MPGTVLVPEMNTGQFKTVLRDQFLVDAQPLNKVSGQPFTIAELEAAIARDVAGIAAGVKLGLEFFAANGPSGVAELGEFGLPIFLDLKLHDIPNTVGKAIQSLRPLLDDRSIMDLAEADDDRFFGAAQAIIPAAGRGNRK